MTCIYRLFIHSRLRKISCHQWAMPWLQWPVSDMHLPSFHLPETAKKLVSPVGHAMAHRWQYKYHIIGTSFVKSGTTIPKACTTSMKSGTTFDKTCTTFPKTCTTFPKTCTTFLKGCTTFSKILYHFMENLYHFSRKLFHFWQNWYQLYHICTVTYGPWLPIGDMKFFALAGEQKRGEMHVTYGPW